MTLEVVTTARAKGVTVVTLPAQCSHELQPLEIRILGPWKTYQAETVRLWHQAHPESTLFIHDMGELFERGLPLQRQG